MASVTYQVIQKPIEDRIIDAACIYWDVDRSYFSPLRPSAETAYRKSIIYYLIKTNTNFTYEAIANKFGFSTHGPVARLIENVEAQKNVFKNICNDINQISHLADRLDAQFITTSIHIVSNNFQKV